MTDKDSSSSDARTKRPIAEGFLKGFITGVVVASVNKFAILGFTVGTIAGIFYEQNYPTPDVGEKASFYWTEIRKVFKPNE